MPLLCASCGAEMPQVSSFCPDCGKAVSTGGGAAARPAAEVIRGALPENFAAVLAYLLLPAVLWLFLEPYKRSRFVRFHCLHALLFAACCALLSVAILVVAMVPGLALLFIPLAMVLICGIVIWSVALMVKAYQGEMYKLPLLGDLAERYAGP